MPAYVDQCQCASQQQILPFMGTLGSMVVKQSKSLLYHVLKLLSVLKVNDDVNTFLLQTFYVSAFI